MNILLKFITVNFSFLDMEKNLKEEFNCEICEEKFIIDQYYLFMRDKTMKFQIHVVNFLQNQKTCDLTYIKKNNHYLQDVLFGFS